MSLKLYFGPGSVSLAALAALEEAGADFDPIRLVLANGEQKSAEYLALNPRGQVPALIAGEQTITENIAVLTFIANRFPNAKMLPFGNLAKLARAYEVLSWFATNVHVAIAQIWRGERFSDDPQIRTGLKEFGAKRFSASLADFDRAASQGSWLLGNQFSVVDPLAFVAWRWAERLELDLSAYPAWADLVARLKARPSVVRALAHEEGPSPAL